MRQWTTSVNRLSIGSDNGLSPIRRQAIIYTNAGLLAIAHLGTYFSEILIKIFFIQEDDLKYRSRNSGHFVQGEMSWLSHVHFCMIYSKCHIHLDRVRAGTCITKATTISSQMDASNGPTPATHARTKEGIWWRSDLQPSKLSWTKSSHSVSPRPPGSVFCHIIMKSSNANIFCVTGPSHIFLTKPPLRLR